MIRTSTAAASHRESVVIGVYDVRRFGEQVFIAMELVDGPTLRDAVRGRSHSEILALYLQAARGLAAAHAVGLVHRDCKPENVLVGRDGRTRVARGLSSPARPHASGRGQPGDRGHGRRAQRR